MDVNIKTILRTAIYKEMDSMADNKNNIIYEIFSDDSLNSCKVIVKISDYYRIYESRIYSDDSIGVNYMTLDYELVQVLRREQGVKDEFN